MNRISQQRKSKIYSNCRLNSPADGIARILSVFCFALSVAFLSLFCAPELQAVQNQIRGINVESETTNEVVLNVSYSYSGNKGNNVFMNVIMAENGKPSRYYGVRPGRIQIGNGITKVKLGTSSSAPQLFTSNQLVASMYVGGGKAFLKRQFSFQKTWAKAGSALTPVLTVVGDIRPLTRNPGQPMAIIPAGSVIPKRRILPNGDVEVTYTDGTVKIFYKGGITIIRPDGSRSTMSFMSAQPPTPPSVPPDDQHAVWLEAENERLLSIIRTLVDNDQASIDNYLLKEGSGASSYQKITFRSTAIEYMLRPHSTN